MQVLYGSYEAASDRRDDRLWHWPKAHTSKQVARGAILTELHGNAHLLREASVNGRCARYEDELGRIRQIWSDASGKWRYKVKEPCSQT